MNDRDLILDRLQLFPEIVQRTIATTAEELWRTKTATTPFALVEHAWHLADLEEEGFGVRIGRMINESDPYLADFNGEETARIRRYLEQAVWPAILRFRAARHANVERLRSVNESGWTRKGTQELVGEITLETLLVSMLRHDIAHANEIVELLHELGVAVPESLAAVAGLEPLARSA
ncbi:MAG TPA: DinB family protein [Thermoanaerobaculia bacterium]|nr:DinB family protein [Thermoanaerobaculia bacterium]